MAGAPEGNQNAVKNKPWQDAIRKAIASEDGKKLRMLAEKLVERAGEGDMAALKELGDRLDGKPKQQIEASGIDGAAILFEKIVREVVKP